MGIEKTMSGLRSRKKIEQHTMTLISEHVPYCIFKTIHDYFLLRVLIPMLKVE